MAKKKYTAVLWYALAAVIVIADYAVKQHIMASYDIGTVFGSIPFICDFMYVKNTGAAFSILSGNTIILGIISVLFCLAVAVYWIVKKNKTPLLKLVLTLLFAGALGNAIDRIAYGFVVDFIAIKWFNFPVFNIADMSIVLGAVGAIIYFLFFDKDGKNNG